MGQVLHFPDIEVRKKAVLHAEAVSIRAGQYAASVLVTIGQAAILLTVKEDGWKQTHDGKAQMYFRWPSSRPSNATGLILNFREDRATLIAVKTAPGKPGSFIVSRNVLTKPGDEIRHHEETKRIFWQRSHVAEEINALEMDKNPFAGWLDVADTVEALEKLKATQLLLPTPGTDAA